MGAYAFFKEGVGPLIKGPIHSFPKKNGWKHRNIKYIPRRNTSTVGLRCGFNSIQFASALFIMSSAFLLFDNNRTLFIQMFGLNRSDLTHTSTCSADACRKRRASSPTQTFSIDVSPSRTLLISVVPRSWAPSWRRMGRALEQDIKVSAGTGSGYVREVGTGKGEGVKEDKLRSSGGSTNLLKRSRLGSSVRPMPSSSRMLMTTLTKSPSIRT